MLLRKREDRSRIARVPLSSQLVYIANAESTGTPLTHLLIKVVTSLSSMVFRPACLAYAARSSPACSKYHADACSMAASVALLIFALDPALEGAKRVANFFTTPVGRLGTGIPCRESFFCLVPGKRVLSSRSPPPRTPELWLGETGAARSSPKPNSPAAPPASSLSSDAGAGAGSKSTAGSSNSSSFIGSSCTRSSPGGGGEGKLKSKLNRPRSSVSPL